MMIDEKIVYDTTDSEALKRYYLNKDLCHRFNSMLPSALEERDAFLNEHLGKVGKNITILSPFFCDYFENIEVGDSFYGNHNLVLLNSAKVVFGDNVLVGPNCCFATPGHPLVVEERTKGIEFAIPIVVEDNVWFGAGVNVLPGIRIGRNSVVGAGSVVTKDIPANVVAVGNPCRVIRELSAEEIGDN